jgi:hypothetical protein
MTEFSDGQWVRIKNGALEGLVGQVVGYRPNGRLLVAVRGKLPTQGVSVLICALKCEATAPRIYGAGGSWSETIPPGLVS